MFGLKQLFIVLFFVSLGAKASYTPVRIYEMVLAADKIVYGEISEMDSLTFTLKIEGNLTGDEKTIRVLKFQNWTCAWRWTKYEVGQKLFLFLVKHEGMYRTISAGNEGELPILNDSIYVHAKSLYSLGDWLPDSNIRYYSELNGIILSQHYAVYGQKYYSHKADFNQFILMVKLLRSCVKADFERYGGLKNIVFLCPEEVLQERAINNEILAWSIDEINRTIQLSKTKL